MIKGTLVYTKRARKGVDHTVDGVVYVHHFGSGWQELVFRDHLCAARFAEANTLILTAPHTTQKASAE